jgi:hypothetical protein
VISTAIPEIDIKSQPQLIGFLVCTLSNPQRSSRTFTEHMFWRPRQDFHLAVQRKLWLQGHYLSIKSA